MGKTIQLSILLCFVLLFFQVIPCNGQNRKEFRLHGTIENGYSGEVILYNTPVNDTCMVDNGCFSFNGNIQEPGSYCLAYAKKRIFFYMEPGEMELFISSSLPLGYHLSGSKTNDENEALNKEKLPLREKRKQIYEMMQSTTDFNKTKSLDLSVDSINNALQLININFIKSHPDSYVSLDELRCLNMDNIPINTIRNMFEGLYPNLKNSSTGKRVDKEIRLYENTAIGLPAPDFTTIDYNGEEISLSSFREKTVILEFWASWCVPCMKSMPHLKVLYDKYKDKGLRIIGISCDNNKNNWINAIKKYKLESWPQISFINSKSDFASKTISDSDIISLYPTNPIPKVFVIDKQGKIINKWVGYSPEQEKEQDEFFESYFK